MGIARTVLTIALALGLAGAATGKEGNPALGLSTTGQPAQVRSAGAAWLVAHQNGDGGWGAGAWGASNGKVASDVATTSLAVMALLRDANGQPVHREAVLRGVRFVVESIERSPLEGARLRGPEGTQPQHKLGRNVDTHFAALLLGEVSGALSGALRDRAEVAYDKVLTKVVAAQKADGSFDGDGWAPVLSSSVAAQSLDRARALGRPVAPEALARSDAYQRKLVDPDSGAIDASEGAGVALYAAASSLRSNSNAAKRAKGDAKGKAEDAAETVAKAVREDRGALVAGFGSVGGEEMLSYMMISDSLAEQGGEDWTAWEERIAQQLAATQNADGSWSGHHCITSTPFVTAAAVMTLGAGDVAGTPLASLGSSDGPEAR